MIIGSYPCCDETFIVELPDRRLPVFGNENCPHCGALVWHLYSRVDPGSWTDKDFREEFEIDEVTKKITKKANA